MPQNLIAGGALAAIFGTDPPVEKATPAFKREVSNIAGKSVIGCVARFDRRQVERGTALFNRMLEVDWLNAGYSSALSAFTHVRPQTNWSPASNTPPHNGDIA